MFPGILAGSSGLHGFPTLSLGGMQNLGGRGPSLLGFWGGRGCLRGKSSRLCGSFRPSFLAFWVGVLGFMGCLL